MWWIMISYIEKTKLKVLTAQKTDPAAAPNASSWISCPFSKSSFPPAIMTFRFDEGLVDFCGPTSFLPSLRVRGASWDVFETILWIHLRCWMSDLVINGIFAFFLKKKVFFIMGFK
ncbi:hypothetical protein RCL_jg22914.t1 [Rhizophagus clarus]|uniref:Uncharacterized protein n=1 Tax=Rhizophagus clarus TaxID=94130 RepID=A0A8H3QM76_9GLOM|nr:hypothetical protein RCL_jg22914.t1 [Rhizophagus clarus]